MEGGRLAATEVDGLMLGDQWGRMTTSIQTTLIIQKCYPRLNHAEILNVVSQAILSGQLHIKAFPAPQQ